jgi:hypothetical protein
MDTSSQTAQVRHRYNPFRHGKPRVDDGYRCDLQGLYRRQYLWMVVQSSMKSVGYEVGSGYK